MLQEEKSSGPECLGAKGLRFQQLRGGLGGPNGEGVLYFFYRPHLGWANPEAWPFDFEVYLGKPSGRSFWELFSGRASRREKLKNKYQNKNRLSIF